MAQLLPDSSNIIEFEITIAPHQNTFPASCVGVIDPEEYWPNDLELIKSISRGTYGDIFKVCHRGENKIYALKLANKRKSGLRDIFETYQNEFDVASTVGHENVAKIIKMIQIGDRRMLLMELYECDLFHFRIRDDWKMQNSAIWIQKIIIGILTGLAAINDKGWVHKDLHAGNILLDRFHVPKICDFGLARQEADIRPWGEELYCMTHGAPEVLAMSYPYTHKADVWSVGCILFFLIYQISFAQHRRKPAAVLEYIHDVVGIPEDSVVWRHSLISTSKKSFIYCQKRVKTCSPLDLRSSFHDKLDLRPMARTLLTVDYKKRPSAESACKRFLCRYLETAL